MRVCMCFFPHSFVLIDMMHSNASVFCTEYVYKYENVSNFAIYLNDEDNNKYLATIVLCVNFTGQFTPPNWHLSELFHCICAMSSIFYVQVFPYTHRQHTYHTSQSVCVWLCYIYLHRHKCLQINAVNADIRNARYVCIYI